MHALVDHFFNRRLRHLGIEVDARRTLADLFTDKAALLQYLRTGVAKGPRAGAFEGKPLVVPGDPDSSALTGIVNMSSHPMHGPMTSEICGMTPDDCTLRQKISA